MTPSITDSKGRGEALSARVLTKAAVALFWLVVWQAAYLFTAQEILLVSPVQAFHRLFQLSGTPLFWKSVGASCARILGGFALAVFAGTALAVATAASRRLYHVFSPVLNIIRSTPVASFIILALVWLSTDKIPSFIAFLMVVPMIWVNIYTGIQNTDRRLLEMAEVFRLPAVKKICAIYIPSIAPYFAAACTNGLGFAWKAGIAAEVIALPRSAIGKQIYNAKIYLETADLFAWTIAVVLLSVFIERLAMAALKGFRRRVGGEPGAD